MYIERLEKKHFYTCFTHRRQTMEFLQQAVSTTLCRSGYVFGQNHFYNTQVRGIMGTKKDAKRKAKLDKKLTTQLAIAAALRARKVESKP